MTLLFRIIPGLVKDWIWRWKLESSVYWNWRRWEPIPSICSSPVSRASRPSSLTSQACILRTCCLYSPFLGLTEEEIQDCVRYETKKRFLFIKITKVEYRCTKNKMSEKYEGKGTSSLLAACPVHRWLWLEYHVTFDCAIFNFPLFHLSTSEPSVWWGERWK